MVKRCMTCQKEHPMDDPKPGVSHGFCPRENPHQLSFCARVWVEWSELPARTKPLLPDYYNQKYRKEREAA